MGSNLPEAGLTAYKKLVSVCSHTWTASSSGRDRNAIHSVFGSTTVTVWAQILVFPQSSANTQVRVTYQGHMLLVTVLTFVVTFAQQLLTTVGVSKFQAEPHCTEKLLGQTTGRQG